jgi:hypothetical protein
MSRTLACVPVVVIALASMVGAQQTPAPPPGPAQPNRFKTRVVGPSSERPPASQPNRIQQLFTEANEIATRLQQSGPWEKHAQEIERAVDSIFSQSKELNDTERFAKRLMIDVSKAPPWDFNARMAAATTLVKERYGLTEEQVKKVQSQFVRNSFTFFVQNAEQILPVAREMIETRTSNKPFTPEMVARWTTKLRPMWNKWYGDAVTGVNKFCEENLTPEQRQKVNQDMVVVSKHAKIFEETAATWAKGEWRPQMWGLDKDPVHVGLAAELARKDAGGAEGKTEPAGAVPPTPSVPPVARGPMRIGDSRAGAGQQAARDGGGPLPDDDQWSAYVRQFIARYSLNEAQKTSAQAVLKDVQDRAKNYRSARSEEITRLENRIRSGKSAEDRTEAQAELREVLKGLDEMFEELKTRLQTIPTAEQIQRAGS